MTATDTADKDRLLHLMFRLLPSQKRYPEYYKTIEKPLDLKMIATKIVEHKYTSTNELEVWTIEQPRLRTPNEAFFIKNQNFWAWADKLGI